MAVFRTLTAGKIVTLGLALAAASVSPLAFVVSAAGIFTLHYLAEVAIIPAIAVWLGGFALSRMAGWSDLKGAFKIALPAGILGTVALEIVRIIGFREFGAMPGSMPELLGVQITNTFMQGPSAWSDLVGWGDHILLNGTGFAFVYIVVFGRQRWFVGTLYALVIATIFMISPATTATGAGMFGQEFAPIGFPLTVYIAHIAFGSTLGLIAARAPSTPDRSLVLAAAMTVLKPLLPAQITQASHSR